MCYVSLITALFTHQNCPDSALMLRRINFHRQTQTYAATRREVEITNNRNDDTSLQKYPIRCSSRDAASIILNCTARDGLLVLSCDASGRGGGSRNEGMAAILRIRHGATYSHSKNTTTCTESDIIDLVDTIFRRRAPSRKSSNEVAAISLGMKRAMCVIPPSWRKKVLIISDSELALGFYCGEHRSSNGGQETHLQTLSKFIHESPDGVFFCKVRSSSRGIGVSSYKTINDNDCSGWDGIGFVDHDAADHLSSVARTLPNKDIDEVGIPFRAVCSLRRADIDWLKNSDDYVACDVKLKSIQKSGGDAKYWNKITVRGSDAREERRKRNERKLEMITEMLGEL
jgi:hypothetical protein